MPADRDIKRAIAAVPSAGAAKLDKLRALPADALLEVVTASKHPWWRRRPCAEALVGRVERRHESALRARVLDATESSEVARACLEALAEAWSSEPTEEVLAWLREARPSGYGMPEAFVRARARLGDVSVAGAAAALVFDPWSHRRAVGEEAMRALVAARELEGVAHALGVAGQTWSTVALDAHAAAARFSAVVLDPEPDAQTLLLALSDPDVCVAHAAHERLVGLDVEPESLLQFADHQLEALARARGAPAPLTGEGAAACWALVVAARKDPSYSMYLELWQRWELAGAPRLEHAGVPDTIRTAILREHLPGQRRTDPRLLVEQAMWPASQNQATDEPVFAWRAHRALEQAGFAPSDPVSAGVNIRQGAGCYHVVDTARFSLRVSDLGPWVDPESELPNEAKRALEQADLELLPRELLQREFEGLPVYFFGRREPLPIVDLLFYWQD